jgi:bifunctional non-homologous end joining protein LigD
MELAGAVWADALLSANVEANCAACHTLAYIPMNSPFLAVLPVRSCLIDGEAIACKGDGLADFELLRYRKADDTIALCAFVELDGKDLRRAPIEERKGILARLLHRLLNEHFDGDGATTFAHACRLGCEGIMSKRLGSRYVSGRSAD